VIFSDTFNRADGNNVDSGWNNPGAVYPNFDILTLALRVRGGIGNIVLVWDTLPAGGNQFSQATIVELFVPNGSQAGLCIRSSIGSGGLQFGYFFDRVNAGTVWALRVVDALGETQLGTVPDTFAVNDVLKIASSGLTVTAYRNGAAIMSGVDPNRGGVPAVGRVGFDDRTGQVTDIFRWGSWSGGDAGTAARILRRRTIFHSRTSLFPSRAAGKRV